MKLEHLAEVIASLACPETKMPLELVSLEEAERRAGGSLVPRAQARDAQGKASDPVGRTPWVLLRADLNCAYPVVEGIPILLAPESLTSGGCPRAPDLTDARYAEAYLEMAFYNEVASQEARDIARSESYAAVAPALEASQAERDAFPHPKERWIDSVYDCFAQWDCYRHLSPIQDRLVLQLGGKGTHAVKFLLAGAEEAWVVTPMLGEALCAQALAEEVGVGDRLRCIVGVAEELPIRTDAVDAICSGGCLHHMQTEMALPEAARVLREGGTFAAMDPWRAPLYSLGTKIFGRREPAESVFDRPLTKARVEPVWGAFHKAAVVQHGALTRYPLIALSKLGVSCSLSVAWHLGSVDDAVCSFVPRMRGMGSSVAVLGTK
ncbi:MAG TPA: methyltransferase domain-containing protein [Thermoleophilia bacterium]